MELTNDQKRRYSRNILLDEIGIAGQKKLLQTSVVIVGSGAIGSVAALYLASSGIGRITIVDFDTIDISNLQRQIVFSESDTGKKKVNVTAERLRSLNSEIEIVSIDTIVTQKNIDEVLKRADIVVEGSDNPNTKYLVSQVCERNNIPYCLAGISQFAAQVMSWSPGCTGYSQVFPDAAEEGQFLPCSVGGVCGPLTGLIGSLQAIEVIKMATGIGEPLFDRLLCIDSLDMKIREVSL